MSMPAFSSNVFRVRIQPGPGDFILEGGRRAKKGTQEHTDIINKVTDRIGMWVALAAGDKMSEALSPEHSNKVGATGEASRNFRLERQSSATGGAVSWSVVTGSSTWANRMIREGIPSGTTPPTEEWMHRKLVAWAVVKKIPFIHPEVFNAELTGKTKQSKLKIREVHYIKSRMDDPRHRDRPARPWQKMIRGAYESKTRTDEDRLSAAMRALQWALYRDGTDRKSSWWNRLYPQGAGKFDYVFWAARQAHYYRREMKKYSVSGAKAIVDFFSTGRAPVGFFREGNKDKTRGWRARTF